MSDITATQIIILGGSGDLSRRKLLPGLLDLFTRGRLPETFNIIGLANEPKTDEGFRDFVIDSLKGHASYHKHTPETIDSFCNHISHVTGLFEEEETYQKLEERLNQFDQKSGIISNRLFYLAVPPKFYGQIFTDLKRTGVADETENTWTHVLVEKPFGNDLETAQALDSQLAELYREDQIFRIDHYLAKEAVQNILSFRFANTLTEAIWSHNSIESVTISLSETIDVGSRGDFYEGVGALRDVGQNHLLQIISLIAMRQPSEFTAEGIRSARAEVLKSLKPLSPEELKESALRAQYVNYKVNENIPDDSQTETFFELKAELLLPEWRGVPFYIKAGKALDKAEVSVTIKLKDNAPGMFETDSCHSKENLIKLIISPEQTIQVTLNAKSPGLGFQLETSTLSFTSHNEDSEIKNSYEKVLYDSITGDQTLFARTEEVLAAWKFITPIMEEWKKLPLHLYEKGSTGPGVSIIK